MNRFIAIISILYVAEFSSALPSYHQVLGGVSYNRKSNKTQCGVLSPGETDFKFIVEFLGTTDGVSANKVRQCGGSLIHRQAVLTSARCVNGKSSTELSLRVKEDSTRDISQIITHPNFNSETGANDIAVLILRTPFELSNKVGIICLPGHPYIQFDVSHCYGSNWSTSKPMYNNRDCTRDSGLFCSSEDSSCSSYAGNPFVCRGTGRNYLLVGMYSHDTKCGSSISRNDQTVYINVSHFSFWIQGTLEQQNLQ